MKKFAWGSCQYDQIAELYEMGMRHGPEEAVRLLKAEGFEIEYTINKRMIDALEEGVLGEILGSWKDCAHDLWFALNSAADMIFTHDIYIAQGGRELENDSPVRIALIAIFCTWYCLSCEDDYKGFAT